MSVMSVPLEARLPPHPFYCTHPTPSGILTIVSDIRSWYTYKGTKCCTFCEECGLPIQLILGSFHYTHFSSGHGTNVNPSILLTWDSNQYL